MRRIGHFVFALKDGTIFGFLGPSGAGKSTIQNIMTGLLPLQRGEVLYEETSVHALKTRFFQQIGVSFEQNNLYPSLTGFENLKYYAALFSVPTIAPMELLERVGLRDDANKRVSNYSKGMKQRLTFARALINQPPISFSGRTDRRTRSQDGGWHPRTHQRAETTRGTAVFLTTHSMDLADALSDTVAFLIWRCEIAACDTPEALKLKYGKRDVRVRYREGGEECENVRSRWTIKQRFRSFLTHGGHHQAPLAGSDAGGDLSTCDWKGADGVKSVCQFSSVRRTITRLADQRAVLGAHGYARGDRACG